MSSLTLSWVGKVPGELDWASPVVAGGSVYVTAGSGGLAVFPADGCGQDFSNAPESSPVVANGVVYVGKGPASGFPVDSGVFTYDARGCGQKTCDPLGFAQTGPEQFYLSSTPAIVNGRVYMGSTDTPTNQAGLYVFALPG